MDGRYGDSVGRYQPSSSQPVPGVSAWECQQTRSSWPVFGDRRITYSLLPLHLRMPPVSNNATNYTIVVVGRGFAHHAIHGGSRDGKLVMERYRVTGFVVKFNEGGEECGRKMSRCILLEDGASVST